MLSLRSLVTGAVALMATPIMALTATQVTDSLKDLTAKSDALVPPAQSIADSVTVDVFVNVFAEVVVGSTDLVAQLEATAPITVAAEVDLIIAAFVQLSVSLQVVLDILSVRVDIVADLVVLLQPVLSILGQEQTAINGIAAELIRIVDSRGAEIQAPADTLLLTLGDVIGLLGL
ncbi:hypothetical protein MFIFM68171_07592 [Madurella fahalii]|uniref:Uncharacterized protein n=1 Tax=Madurella fahalii TaxID=1157608 RepID=A0ABQ0GI22_9PEZI